MICLGFSCYLLGALGIEPETERLPMPPTGINAGPQPGDVRRAYAAITTAQALLGDPPRRQSAGGNWGVVIGCWRWRTPPRGRVTSNERIRFHKRERNA